MINFSKPACLYLVIIQAANSVRYFGDRDVDGMIATLAPLHDQVKRVSAVS